MQHAGATYVILLDSRGTVPTFWESGVKGIQRLFVVTSGSLPLALPDSDLGKDPGKLVPFGKIPASECRRLSAPHRVSIVLFFDPVLLKRFSKPRNNVSFRLCQRNVEISSKISY